MRIIPLVIIAIFLIAWWLLKPKANPKDVILEILSKQPQRWWLGLEIIAASDGRLSRATIYIHLSDLVENKLVNMGREIIQSAHSDLPPRTIYRISRNGIRELAKHKTSAPLTPQTA